MRIRLAPFFLTGFASLLLVAPSALPCSCFGDLPPRAALEQAQAVFLGEVIGQRELDVTEDGFPMAIVFRFRVSLAWKGVQQQTVEVGTSSMGTACGFDFVEGEEYLVYASVGSIASASWPVRGGEKLSATSPRPEFWTSACTRTSHFRNAEEKDFPELGRPAFRNEPADAHYLSDELLHACTEGDTSRIQELLRAGHDVNGRDRRHRTSSLIAAASSGHTESVRVLIEAGADVNIVKYRRTALEAAIETGHLATVQLLLSSGARPNAEALTQAAGLGHATIVDALLRAGAKVNEPGQIRGALAAACIDGHLDVVRSLLDAGAATEHEDVFGETALDIAARQGYVEIVRHLLGRGAKVRDGTLEEAASSGNGEILRLLYDARKQSGSSVEVSADTLIRASDAKDVSGLSMLLETGVDPDLSNERGNIPLVVATINGSEDAVRMLLRAGADVDRKDGQGWTALMKASSRYDTVLIEILLDAGADVNASAKDGVTFIRKVRVDASLEEHREAAYVFRVGSANEAIGAHFHTRARLFAGVV